MFNNYKITHSQKTRNLIPPTGKILILYSSSAEHLGLFNDLKSNNNVILLEAKIRSSKFKLLQKIHLSKKLNNFIKLPYKHIQYTYYNIEQSNLKAVVVMGTALDEIDFTWLNKVKSRGAITILYLIDSMNASSPKLQYNKHKIKQFKWDYIFSFDKKDAIQYNFTYLGFNYYSKHQIPLNEKPQNDAYFIGGLKGGRTKLINNTYKYLTKNGIKCDFKTMIYKPISNQDIVSGINYITNGWISYENVLKDISNSKCLIEILQQEQHGPSLRYFESVCYNKKLLTNNPLIKDYPYYNPLYMKIFNDINDIDIDWLQQEVMIDYEYKDEFSPLNLIKYINALVSR